MVEVETKLDKVLLGIHQSENLSIEGVQNLIPETGFADVYHLVRPLIDDGYVESQGQGYYVTLKGKMFISKGGYTGQLKKERNKSIITWITLIASVLSLIVGAIAVFK